MRSLLDAGARVAVLDLRDNSDLRGDKTKFFKTDITNDSEVEASVEAVITWSKETGATIGGVVNCAGIATAAKVCPVFDHIRLACTDELLSTDNRFSWQPPLS